MPITVDVPDLGTVEFPDETSPEEIQSALRKHLQTNPKVSISPYEKYRLGNDTSFPPKKLQEGGEISGPMGPANPEEVLALPQLLKLPAAAIEATGIPQAGEEVAADFLRRTGINPAAQAGESLAPTREQETYIPSPLEEAFPSLGRGLEETARGFVTPGNVGLAPFAGLKPVQLVFQAQMAAGVPEQVQQAIEAPNTEERTQAISQALLGIAAGAHAILPKAAREAVKSVESEVPNAEAIRSDTGQLPEVRQATEGSETISGNDLRETPPGQGEGVTQGQTEVGKPPQIPLNQTPLGGTGSANASETISLQSPPNRVNTARKLAGNSDDALTLLDQGFDALPANSKKAVMSRVVSSLENNQVLDTVVKLIPVDVMNNLIGKENTSKVLLGDNTVLKTSLSRIATDLPIGHDVSGFIDNVLSTPPLAGALFGAEKPLTSSALSNLPSKNLRTVGTGNVHEATILQEAALNKQQPTPGQEAQVGVKTEVPLEEAPPSAVTGEAQPSEAPVGAGTEGAAVTAPTPQPLPETKPLEPAKQAETVTTPVTAPESQTKRTIKDAWLAYDEDGTIQTPRELADTIEGIHGESGVPAYVLRALNGYRKAIELDFSEYAGRYDVDTYEEKFLAAVEKAASAKQRRAKPTPPSTQESGPGTIGQAEMGAAGKEEIPETGAGGEKYGVAERVREERAKAGQVEPVPPGEGISTPESIERGRDIIRQDPEAAEKAMAAFEADPKKAISADAMAAARAHGEALAAGARTIEEQFGTDSEQYRAAFKALSDWDKRSKAMQTEWHKTGMAQQGETDLDTASFTGLQRAYREVSGKEFTPEKANTAKRKAKGVKTAATETEVARDNLNKAIKKAASDADKRALLAAAKTVRENAVRIADEETVKRVDQAKTLDDIEKIQQDAAKRAVDLAQETSKKAAAKLADAENKARVAKTVTERQQAAEQIKAAKKAIDAAQKIVRDSAARMAKEARRNLANPEIAVWQKARDYLDQGLENFDDLRNKVAADLGMSVNKVSKLITGNKRLKYLSDEVWLKQQKERRLREDARRWLASLDTPTWRKAVASIPRALFGMKVWGHGTVALGTHAPAVAFQPRFWANYAKNYGRMARMVVDKSFYERQMQDLVRRKNYTIAARAGLVNDPFVYEDYSNPDTVKYFTGGGAGNRGYSVLKILRQDMFDQMWNKLPKHAQISEVATAIADGVNHATGVVKAKAHPALNVAFFAPRLEASRVAWLAVDPIKAAMTFKDWKSASLGEKQFAINQVKEKAWVMGTFMAMLAANQGILSAVNSKQKINFDDPMKSDWLKFKVAGMQASYGNAMLAMARLPARLYEIRRSEGGKLKKVIYPDESIYTVLGETARSQLSPFAGIAFDLASGVDYARRPLPNSNRPVPARLAKQGIKPYTWTEYISQATAPIPAQEAMKEVWKYGMGMSDAQIKQMEKAMATIAFMGLTGGRLNEDWTLNDKHEATYK